MHLEKITKKHVRFNDTLQIEYIVNKDYYVEENIMKDIWWSKEHYLMSRYFANKEFQMIKRVFPNVMFKQSLQMFYLDEETNRIKTFSLDEGIVMIPRNKVKHVFIEKDGNDPRIRQSNTNGGRQMKLFFSLR